MRVLVTGAGGPAGIALGTQLIDLGHTVIGVDMHPVPGAHVTEQYLVPAAADPRLLGDLRDIAQRTGAELIIPTVSDELPALALAAAEFTPLAPVVIGEPAAVRLADDKLLTMRRLAEAQVAVPRYALPSEFASLEEALDRLGSPLIAKPRVSRGGRGVQLLDASSGEAWAELDDTQVLQEFAPGTEFAPVLFRGPGAEPEVWVLRKTGLKQGLVGNATGVSPEDAGEHPDIATLAVSAAAALGLTGPVDLDIRLREDGSPVVLEVNARFGANSRSAPGLLGRVLDAYAPAEAA